jgi:hypothetical protein
MAFLLWQLTQEGGHMATKSTPVNAPKTVVKRKEAKNELTFADVQTAAKGGNEACEHFAKHGTLPAR